MKSSYISVVLCLICFSSVFLITNQIVSQTPIIKQAVHGAILISSDDDFKNYNFTGIGTEIDPYTLQNYLFTGLSEKAISITNTTKYFVLKNCDFDSNTEGCIFVSDAANGTTQIHSNSMSNSIGNSINLKNCTHSYVTENYIVGAGAVVVDHCANSTFYRNSAGSMSGKFFITDSPNCNFTMNGASGSHLAPGDGFRFERSDNLTFIRGGSIFNMGYGIVILDSDDCFIQFVNIDHNLGGAFLIENSNNVILSTNVIYPTGNFKTHIRNCYNLTMFKHQYGTSLLFQDCSLEQLETFTIIENYLAGHLVHFFKNLNDIEFRDLMVGQLILVNCSEIIVSNVSTSISAQSLFIGYSKYVSITRNYFYDSTFTSMHIIGSEDITVENNYFWYSYTGLELISTSRCTIRFNDFRENNVGLFLDFSSSNNTIHHNSFRDNSLQAVDYGADNIWYDVETLEGNYWSDLGGADNYTIFGTAGSVDLYPLNYVPEIKEYSTAVIVLALFIMISAVTINLRLRRKKRSSTK